MKGFGAVDQKPFYGYTLNSTGIWFIDEVSSAAAQPPAFLQVGDWTYPLIPGQSPMLLSHDGSYIFPDLRIDAEAEGELFRLGP
jgi:hypothetical protein